MISMCCERREIFVKEMYLDLWIHIRNERNIFNECLNVAVLRKLKLESDKYLKILYVFSVNVLHITLHSTKQIIHNIIYNDFTEILNPCN